MNHINKRK